MSTISASASTANKRLEGKVALITGGASGMGESSAKLFVKHGAKVVIADIQDELGHKLCRELGTEETISYVHCDVTSDPDVKNAVDFAVNKYAKLDIMFSNAGIAGNVYPSIVDTENEDFKRVFDVNVFGAFLAAKHAARVMIPDKKKVHPYVASKHAILGLAKNLSLELGQHGIRVNCVSPFVVITPMMRKAMGVMEAEKEKLQQVVSASANLKNVMLEGEDIAEAAVYLVSDESKHVSGLNLVVDGGYTLTNPSFAMSMQSFHDS